ncbi:MAG: hypothetical protein HRK26_02305 [Rickettsiaceae bacterium H1]|nr:hypothetical protein [Rickettsiaceae bacterium H1]
MNNFINTEVVNYDFSDQPLVINNNESATKIANQLIEKLQELQDNLSNGKTSYHLLKQLKEIVFCIYYSAENKYTAILHDIVSYVLVQIFKYEN